MKSSLWEGGLAWFLFLYFLLNIGLGVFPPLLPQIMESLGFGFAAAGLLGTAFGLARFAVALPAALLAERIGFTRVLQAGIAFFAAGSVLSAVAPSLPVLLAARACLGLGSGINNIISVLYLLQSGPVAQRNRRANLCELSVIAGMAVSSELGGFVGGRWGWRESFWLAAALFMAAWLLATYHVLPLVEQATCAPALPERPPSRRAPSRLSAAILAIYLLMFAQAFAWGGGINTLLPLYGGTALGLSTERIGRIMAIAFWVEVCLLFPVGWAADLWGKRRVLLPGFSAMLAGSVLLPVAGGLWGYGFTFALVTSGMSVWMLSPALMQEELGDFRGRSAGFYRLVTDLAFILSPAIVGWLIGAWGFTAAGLSIATVVAAALALAGLSLFRKNG